MSPRSVATLALIAASSSLSHGTTHPDRGERLSQATVDAYIALVLGPEDNGVKACADSALELNKGLTFMQMGKSSDADVEKALAGNGDDANLPSEEVKRKIELWRSTRSSGTVAAAQFESCMAAEYIDTRLGTLGAPCFGAAVVPAAAEVVKQLGFSQARAVSELKTSFGEHVSQIWLKQVISEIYATDTVEGSRQIHRRAFVQCLQGYQKD